MNYSPDDKIYEIHYESDTFRGTARTLERAASKEDAIKQLKARRVKDLEELGWKDVNFDEHFRITYADSDKDALTLRYETREG